MFLYCDSLEEVRIPGVLRLGKQAFVNDVQLRRIEISRQLQEDGICDVFTGCGNLREFSFADGEYCVIPNAVEAVAGANVTDLLTNALTATMHTYGLPLFLMPLKVSTKKGLLCQDLTTLPFHHSLLLTLQILQKPWTLTRFTHTIFSLLQSTP